MEAFFRNAEHHYAPMVKAVLYDPLGLRNTEVELLIDTGFSGGVLVPLRVYIDLELHHFEEPKVAGSTAIGYSIELRKSRGLIKIDGETLRCTIYSALGVKRPLLGREVLARIGMLYNPPREIMLGLKQ